MRTADDQINAVPPTGPGWIRAREILELFRRLVEILLTAKKLLPA